MHDSYADGVSKWERRAKRIVWGNIVIVGNAALRHDPLNAQLASLVGRLPYPSFFLVNGPTDPSRNAFHIRENRGDKTRVTIEDYYGILGKRYLDDFDFPHLVFHCHK